VVYKLLCSLTPLVLDDRNIAEECPLVLVEVLHVVDRLSCQCRIVSLNLWEDGMVELKRVWSLKRVWKYIFRS